MNSSARLRDSESRPIAKDMYVHDARMCVYFAVNMTLEGFDHQLFFMRCLCFCLWQATGPKRISRRRRIELRSLAGWKGGRAVTELVNLDRMVGERQW